ncbi:MAG: MoaD/ThiS family protein [Candidatus Lokiarchaeota archaeon]|nr:MoaD/ThiS family protein [Candidatus Lokiarchaeota archaeon]
MMQKEISSEVINVPREVIVEKKMSVGDLLGELGISKNKYFAVLVNGKKVDTNHQIDESDKIIILPLIAGG